MSTTDTRAAFEAHYRKECGMPDDVAIQWDTPYIAAAWDGWQSALTWQAATEAAKATGTAGEPEPCGGCGNSDPDKRCIGCGHPFLAARQPAPVVAVKTWQERMPDYARHLTAKGAVETAMEAEIAELRAALAATNRSQP